jgi:hypothetical protein
VNGGLRGCCNARASSLCERLNWPSAEATEAVEVASAIWLIGNLTHLVLHKCKNGFTDEAGVTLAEALTVNKSLRMLRLFFLACTMKQILGVSSYEALAAMLRVNTSPI